MYRIQRWCHTRRAYYDVYEPTTEDLRQCALLDAAQDRNGYADIPGIGTRTAEFIYAHQATLTRWLYLLG